MPKSRRKAREAALQALYQTEMGHEELEGPLSRSIEANELAPDLGAYARRAAEGVLDHHKDLDQRLASLIKEYDFQRIAAIDRNVMRLAAYELFHEPAIPPAVTINEAIEIAKKYSTAESGRFVNGVLGRLLKDSPKATWDPATAPKEEEPEELVREPEPEVQEEFLEAGSEEAQQYARVAGWKLRTEDLS